MHTDARYSRRWQALVVLALSLFVVTVGNTILNVALPTIRAELDASSSQLQWIVDSYLLVFAGLLMAAGSLGDRFGRRRALMTGLVIFGVGSALAAVSSSSTRADRVARADGPRRRGDHAHDALDPHEHLPGERAAEGDRDLGRRVRSRHRRRPDHGRLADRALRLEQRLPRQHPHRRAACSGRDARARVTRPGMPRLDLVGAGLSTAGLSALVWGLIEAPGRGWTSSGILAAFAVGVAIMAAFVAWEHRTAHPMLDVRVFRNARFSAASVSIAFMFFALMGVVYFLTTYVQTVLGYGTLTPACGCCRSPAA